MREIKFRVWNLEERKMYFRGYQKLTHVLLCEDDAGRNQGKGLPVKRAKYDSCQFLESTGLEDKHGREIFEGDILQICWQEKIVTDIVDPVPDMFRSRKLHPLHGLLIRHGIPENGDEFEVKILGNRYETPAIDPSREGAADLPGGA